MWLLVLVGVLFVRFGPSPLLGFVCLFCFLLLLGLAPKLNVLQATNNKAPFHREGGVRWGGVVKGWMTRNSYLQLPGAYSSKHGWPFWSSCVLGQAPGRSKLCLDPFGPMSDQRMSLPIPWVNRGKTAMRKVRL